jgi:hypothetical protein
MPIKILCFKARDRSTYESMVPEYEKEGYTFGTVIPISSDPTFADMCIILEKPKDK